jgi:hypothetical protein
VVGSVGSSEWRRSVAVVGNGGFLLLQDRQDEEGMRHSGIEEWWEDNGAHWKK